jgi:hypothetical protein
VKQEIRFTVALTTATSLSVCAGSDSELSVCGDFSSSSKACPVGARPPSQLKGRLGGRVAALDCDRYEEEDSMNLSPEPRTAAETEALRQLAAFPLVDALYGRRSRRFALGGEIPDGPLAYRSKHEPLPITELERMLVLSAMGGTTGWHYSITRHARYAPHVSNYAAGAAGCTFPSAAGFHTAELFFNR